jgi:ABC-type glycerol-3-phosphate transport system substrate-binding protein
MTLFYNKALLKKAGYKTPPTNNSKAFIAAAKKLTRGSGDNKVWGFLQPPDWPVMLEFPSLLYQFGGTVVNKNGKAAFNNKAGRSAVGLMYDLIYKYKVSPPKTVVDQDVKMLGNGTVAMIIDGPWMYGHAALKPLRDAGNLGVAPFPKLGPKRAVAAFSHYLVAYTKNTPDQNAAVIKFAEYFNKHALPMAQSGPVPVYKPLLKSKAVKKVYQARVISSMLKYAKPAVASVPRYRDSYLYPDFIVPLLQGKKNRSDINSGLKEAADKMTKYAEGG